jgi:hypothetical protein
MEKMQEFEAMQPMQAMKTMERNDHDLIMISG